MPEVTPADAARTLIEQVRAMGPGELRDAHNELFPQTPIPPMDAGSDGDSVRQKVIDYLAREVAVEEILDIWKVVFPEAWNVYYDEETGMIHYLVEPEAIKQAD